MAISARPRLPTGRPNTVISTQKGGVDGSADFARIGATRQHRLSLIFTMENVGFLGPSAWPANLVWNLEIGYLAIITPPKRRSRSNKLATSIRPRPYNGTTILHAPSGKGKTNAANAATRRPVHVPRVSLPPAAAGRSDLINQQVEGDAKVDSRPETVFIVGTV